METGDVALYLIKETVRNLVHEADIIVVPCIRNPSDDRTVKTTPTIRNIANAQLVHLQRVPSINYKHNLDFVVE